MRSGTWIVTGLVAALACSSGSDGPPTGGGNNTPGSLSGRVIDTDSASAGVGNVSVVLASGANQQTVTTTSNGTFSLANAAPGGWTATVTAPATHRLAANETGTRSVTVTSGQNTALGDFVLRRPHGALAGSVTESGTAAAGGSVTVTRGGFSARNATPGNDGTFTVASVPVGAWTVQYVPPTEFLLTAGETGTRTVTVTENQTATVTAFEVRRPPPQSGLVEIQLTSGQLFSPSSVTIAPGTTVRWINDAALHHTITPENTNQPGVWARQETTTAGVVFEHTFTVANQTYRYRCEPHSSGFGANQGMVGVIVVTP